MEYSEVEKMERSASALKLVGQLRQLLAHQGAAVAGDTPIVGAVADVVGAEAQAETLYNVRAVAECYPQVRHRATAVCAGLESRSLSRDAYDALVADLQALETEIITIVSEVIRRGIEHTWQEAPRLAGALRTLGASGAFGRRYLFITDGQLPDPGPLDEQARVE